MSSLPGLGRVDFSDCAVCIQVNMQTRNLYTMYVSSIDKQFVFTGTLKDNAY